MADSEKSNHWDLLASELGATPPSADTQRKELPSEGAEQETTPPVEERPAIPESVAPEQPPAQRTPRRSAAKPKRRAADWDALAGELGVEPQPAMHKPAVEEPLPEPATREAPIEKPAESAPPARLAEDSEPAARPAEDPEPEEQELGLAGEPAEDAPGSDDAPGSEEASQPPKRRRRRRPSRKKKKDGETTQAAGDRDSRVKEPVAGPKDRDRSTAKKAKSSRKQADEPEPTEDAKTARVSHRAIPTWEEAVGLMVSANLESRSKRPSGGSSRGRGRGRGSNKAQGAAKSRGSRKKPSTRSS